MLADKVHLFLNPTAGRGRAGRRQARIIEIMTSAGVDVQLHNSESVGDLERKVAAAVTDGARRVVVAGGDGSIHEAVNGILESAAGSIVLTERGDVDPIDPADDPSESGFFHVEMFYALPGLAGDLMEQRRMENEYLAATGQVPNFIFRRSSGSDVDVFTIGCHESLETFAAPAPATDEEKQNAARDAGFDGLSDISFYLRSLISGHQDTLAVKVE